jgi:hypothetical protein
MTTTATAAPVIYKSSAPSPVIRSSVPSPAMTPTTTTVPKPSWTPSKPVVKPSPAPSPLPSPAPSPVPSPAPEIADGDRPTLTLAEVKLYLKGTPAPFSGFDKSRSEQYLGEDEFKGIFGVSKSEWSKYPKWKQEPIRKKLGFF